MVSFARLHASTETYAATRLSGAWITAWACAQICLVLAALLLMPAVPARGQSSATAATNAPRSSSAPAVTLSSPSPALQPEVAAGPSAPAPTPTDAPLFYAALHVGDAWLVLHRLAPSGRPAPAAAVRAVPLTQGEAVLLTRLGPPVHPGYTLVAGGETCSTRAVGQVRLELDSGEPGDHSALGPTWIADEIAACPLDHQPRTPFVAIAGKSQSYPAPTLAPLRVAQRVKFDPPAPSDCEGNAEVVEAQLEIAGRSFEVTRVSGDPDVLSVIELGGSVALNTRAALTWDSAGVGC